MRLKGWHEWLVVAIVLSYKLGMYGVEVRWLRAWSPRFSFRGGFGIDSLLAVGGRHSDSEVGVEGAVAGDVHPRTVLAWASTETADLSLAARQAP